MATTDPILSAFSDVMKDLSITPQDIAEEVADFHLQDLDAVTRRKLASTGIETLGDFADPGIEICQPEMFFFYQRRPILVYIRDQKLGLEEYHHGRYQSFHLCMCDSLKKMNHDNHFQDRYVLTYNASGRFYINLTVRDKNFERNFGERYVKLPVCQDCLRKLNWKNFRAYCGTGTEWYKGGNSQKRRDIVKEFDLQEFFHVVKGKLFEDDVVYYTAELAVKKAYQLMPEQKAALKRSVDFCCEICGQKFSARDLYIHHIDHNEGNNRRSNLLVICDECHMHIHDQEGGFMQQLREKQTRGEQHQEAVENLVKWKLIDRINELRTHAQNTQDSQKPGVTISFGMLNKIFISPPLAKQFKNYQNIFLFSNANTKSLSIIGTNDTVKDHHLVVVPTHDMDIENFSIGLPRGMHDPQKNALFQDLANILALKSPLLNDQGIITREYLVPGEVTSWSRVWFDLSKAKLKQPSTRNDRKPVLSKTFTTISEKYIRLNAVSLKQLGETGQVTMMFDMEKLELIIYPGKAQPVGDSPITPRVRKISASGRIFDGELLYRIGSIMDWHLSEKSYRVPGEYDEDRNVLRYDFSLAHETN